MKQCSHCERILPFDDFHKNKAQPDGYNYWCKECHKDWRESYKATKQEYDKQYRMDNAERKKQTDKNWYYNNQEYAKAQMIKYRKEHPEIFQVYQQTEKYKIMHRKCVRKQNARRRNLGFNELWENPFPDEVEIDWHHINDFLIIPMPKQVHNLCSHPNPEEHRERCNVWLYYLYSIDVELLFK